MPWLSLPRREPSRCHEPCEGRLAYSCYFIQILPFYITNDLFHLSLSQSSGFQPRSFSRHRLAEDTQNTGHDHTRSPLDIPFPICFLRLQLFFYPNSSIYYHLVRYPQKEVDQCHEVPSENLLNFPTSNTRPLATSYLIDVSISVVVCSSLLPPNHVPASSATAYRSSPFITVQSSSLFHSSRLDTCLCPKLDMMGHDTNAFLCYTALTSTMIFENASRLTVLSRVFEANSSISTTCIVCSQSALIGSSGQEEATTHIGVRDLLIQQSRNVANVCHCDCPILALVIRAEELLKHLFTLLLLVCR